MTRPPGSYHTALRGLGAVTLAHLPGGTTMGMLNRVWTRDLIPPSVPTRLFFRRTQSQLTATYGLASMPSPMIQQLDFDGFDGAGTVQCCGVADALPNAEPFNFGVAVVKPQTGKYGFEKAKFHLLRREGWARPEMAAPTLASPKDGHQRVASLWRDTPFVPWPADMADPDYDMGATVRGPLTLSALMSTDSGMREKSWTPRHVGAKGIASTLQFYVTYARRRAPLRKQFIVVNGADPSEDRVPSTTINDLSREVFRPTDAHAADVELDPPGARSARLVASEAEVDIAPIQAQNSGYFRDFVKRSGAPHNYVAPMRISLSDILDDMVDSPRFPRHGGTPSGDDLEPLDDYIYGLLIRWGTARAIQVCAARDGKIIVARAYTFAEEGYPVTRNSTPFRIASMSKALLPLPLLDKLGVAGLSKNLGDYGISGVGPNQLLSSVTLRQMLHFTAGFPKNFEEDVVAKGARPTEGPPARLGDIQSFVRSYASNLFTVGDPGETYTYSSFTGAFVGELISDELSNHIAFDDYPEQMREWMRLSVSQAFTAGNTKEAHVSQGIVPIHTQGFSLTDTIWVPNSDDPTWGSALWGNLSWKAASGGWAMSAATFIRVCCGLMPTSLAPRLLSADEVTALWNDPNPPNPQVGLVWAKIDEGPLPPTMNVGGQLPGTRCGAIYQAARPASDQRRGNRSAWAVCMTVNGDGRVNVNSTVLKQIKTYAGIVPDHVDYLPELYPGDF